VLVTRQAWPVSMLEPVQPISAMLARAKMHGLSHSRVALAWTAEMMEPVSHSHHARRWQAKKETKTKEQADAKQTLLEQV